MTKKYIIKTEEGSKVAEKGEALEFIVENIMRGELAGSDDIEALQKRVHETVEEIKE